MKWHAVSSTIDCAESPVVQPGLEFSSASGRSAHKQVSPSPHHHTLPHRNRLVILMTVLLYSLLLCCSHCVAAVTKQQEDHV